MIENEVLPSYAEEDLSAAAVLCGREPSFAQGLDREFDLERLEIVLDLEHEVVDRYVVPDLLFPLTIVIDRDGVVVHKDNQDLLEEAVLAIDEAL